MENIPQPKKKVGAMSKNAFAKLCHPVPEEKVRARINLIIYDNRKNQKMYAGLTKKKVIGTHFIERVEVIEYFETYGWPNGYEL